METLDANLILCLWTVYRTFESIEELRNASQNFGTPIDAFVMDVASDESVAKAKKYLEYRTAEYGGLHGLVNNAGILGKAFFDDFLNTDDYKEVAEVTAWGAIRVTQAMKPLVKHARGRIVTILSACSRVGIPGIGPYTAAKFAIAGYCEVIRQELRMFGVSVHVLEPGFFKTALTDPENTDKQLMSLYERCPQSVKREYGREFFVEMRKKNEDLLNLICSSRTDHVVDAYLHALTAVYPRTRYQLGWDMILLFGPGSLLPSAMQDLIIKVITALVDVPTPLAMQKKI
ncbi:DeHydrogenases Short chain, partial [Trichostrongylus colubriformis]